LRTLNVDASFRAARQAYGVGQCRQMCDDGVQVGCATPGLSLFFVGKVWLCLAGEGRWRLARMWRPRMCTCWARHQA
jgi:hypothetical protein